MVCLNVTEVSNWLEEHSLSALIPSLEEGGYEDIQDLVELCSKQENEPLLAQLVPAPGRRAKLRRLLQAAPPRSTSAPYTSVRLHAPFKVTEFSPEPPEPPADSWPRPSAGGDAPRQSPARTLYDELQLIPQEELEGVAAFSGQTLHLTISPVRQRGGSDSASLWAAAATTPGGGGGGSAHHAPSTPAASPWQQQQQQADAANNMGRTLHEYRVLKSSRHQGLFTPEHNRSADDPPAATSRGFSASPPRTLLRSQVAGHAGMPTPVQGIQQHSSRDGSVFAGNHNHNHHHNHQSSEPAKRLEPASASPSVIDASSPLPRSQQRQVSCASLASALSLTPDKTEDDPIHPDTDGYDEAADVRRKPLRRNARRAADTHSSTPHSASVQQPPPPPPLHRASEPDRPVATPSPLLFAGGREVAQSETPPHQVRGGGSRSGSRLGASEFAAASSASRAGARAGDVPPDWSTGVASTRGRPRDGVRRCSPADGDAAQRSASVRRLESFPATESRFRSGEDCVSDHALVNERTRSTLKVKRWEKDFTRHEKRRMAEEGLSVRIPVEPGGVLEQRATWIETTLHLSPHDLNFGEARHIHTDKCENLSVNNDRRLCVLYSSETLPLSFVVNRQSDLDLLTRAYPVITSQVSVTWL